MGIPAQDPKGYYTALGLDRSADLAAVKVAYRSRAKLLHPDHNPSPDAAAKFQHLNDAYQTLGDPGRRAAYDTEGDLVAGKKKGGGGRPETGRSSGGSKPGTRHPPPPPPPQQPTRTGHAIDFFPCSECGRISAQPRYIVFERVHRQGGKALREPVYGIFCPVCAERVGIRATMFTWIRGWWGLPMGPIYAIAAIVRNMFGGYLPKDANARVLLHQAKAFQVRGDQDIARAIAGQALKFCAAPDTLRDVTGLLTSLGNRPGSRLRRRWTRWGRGLLVQASPALGGFVILVGLLHAFGGSSSAPEAASARVDVGPVRSSPPVFPSAQPSEIEGTFHVAVPKLNVRNGPGAKFGITASLERFVTVEASRPTGRNDWVHIQAPGGITGYVASQFLAPGPGWQAQQQWCLDNRGAPVSNGTVLLASAKGPHRLVVRNTTDDDIVIKLRSPDNTTKLSLYVQARDLAQATEVPDGTFQVLIATGKDYSRACGVFLTEMRTVSYPNARTFQSKTETGQTVPSTVALTLRPPNSGYTPAQKVPEALFVD
ncbi:MAG: DnaJ domain-containing protein [Alphaproteobacteria bacterium]